MQIFNEGRHISQDAIGLHALNDLPRYGNELVNDHLSYCERCRRDLGEMKDVIRMFRAVTKTQRVRASRTFE
jgi:hypothetical protein